MAAILFAPAAAIAAPGSLEDFRLPPSSKPQPEVQGPVTPREPLRPAPPPVNVPLPKPKPSPSVSPSPSPTATPTPGTSPRAEAAAPEAARPDNGESAAGTEGRRASETPQTSSPPQGVTGPDVEAPSPATGDETPATPRGDATDSGPQPGFDLPGVETQPETAPSPATATPSPDSGNPWLWLAALAIAAIGAVGAAWWWIIRQGAQGPSLRSVPTIERPRPRAEPAPRKPATSPPPSTEPEIAPAAVRRQPIAFAFEPTKLSITLMNATLSYRLTVSNRARRPFDNIRIGGDILSAHASLPMEEQVTQAGDTLELRHELDTLLPGQNAVLSGQIALPLRSVRAVRRGEIVLFVPLARWKIDAGSANAIVLCTALVGQNPAGPGAGLRPFRLDLGPAIYSEIGQRTIEVPSETSRRKEEAGLPLPDAQPS